MKKKLNSLLSLLLAIVALSPTAEADVLTVANGSDKNEFAPAFFYCGDEAGTKTVTIYPKAELTGLAGNITAMKFYLNGTFYFSSTPPAVEVKLAILDANTIIDDINDIDDAWGKGTLVAADVKPTNNLSYWEITFDTPFSYSGGDLVVMTNFKTKGKDSSKAFLGKNTTSVSAYCNKKKAYPNSSGLTTHNFLPKVDITYEKLNPYAANVSTTELDFGLVNVFDQTTTVNLTVFNTGANPITPNVSGLSEPFSTTYTPTEVAAGASVEVPVTITTDKVGMYTDSLTVDCGNGIDPIIVAVTALAASYTHYGEETNFYAPIWHEKTQTKDNKSMVVYPADDISAMKDKIITGMTFYSTEAINPTTKPTIEVRLAKIDDISSISYSSIDAVWKTGTTVAKSVMQTGDFYGVYYWNIVFDNEFTYTGGNLAFISNVDVAGSGEPRIYFYGVKTSDKRSFNTSAGNGNYSYFIPTTAWTFKEADAYDIKIDENMTNGTVYPDKTSASIGETVTLIADPADGYELENIAVNAGYEAPGSSGGGRAPRKTRILQGSIELTKVNDYTYTFVIPEKIKNALGDEEALKDNTDFLVSATFKAVQTSTTLAQALAGSETNVNVSDVLVVAAVVGNTLYLADANGAAVQAPEGEQVDYMGAHFAEWAYDKYSHNNWVAVTVDDASAYSEGKTVSTVVGTLDKSTATITATEALKVDSEAQAVTVIPNLYTPASFTGEQTQVSTRNTYFFAVPKLNELVNVTWALWNGTQFVVLKNESDIKGSFALAEGGVEPGTLVENTIYYLKGIVKPAVTTGGSAPRKAQGEAGNPGTAAFSLMLLEAPTTEDNTITGLTDVRLNGTVSGVEYYDVAGRRSTRPFEGLNIVVTRYSDGSVTTSKMVK